MDCQRFETLLSDFQADSLSPPVAEAMGRHEKSCARCATLALEVVRLREELAGLPDLTVRPELVEAILKATTGVRKRGSLWHDLLQPTLTPFFSQRVAFATLIMFVFISVMANVMGPEFSAYSRNPSLLLEKADQVSTRIYGGWRQFNNFKTEVAEELALLKDDLFGRLDYHLITLLFREYEPEPQSPAPQQPEVTRGGPAGGSPDKEEENDRR